ncbi:MAG: Asp23/Gls24 family envelope stress response protein [Actinomycetota bacterium]|nr:Asp23/Gls24 family envelope stress response protein [Actinomycetota bacterium]
MTFDPYVSPLPVPATVPAEPQPVDPADVVVAAVTGVDGVAAMHAGMFGEVATYLPGRKVVGVQIRREVTNVDVVLDWGVSVPATAERVREVVEALVGTPVHVTVQDITEPGPPVRL